MSKKLTNLEFVEKCRKIHKNFYDYSETIYTRNRDDVIIICPIHGKFTKNAAQHINGKGCNECNYNSKLKEYLEGNRKKPKRYRVDKSEQALKPSKPSFQERLDKLKLFLNSDLTLIEDYKPVKNKFKVVDRLGIEYLVKYFDLLKGGHPKITSAVNKTKAFSIKLKLIHPTLTVISEYTTSENNILVKDALDIVYLVRANDLLQGSRPTIQSAVDKIDCFSKKANIVHHNKYDYSKINYIDTFTKISIFCKEHRRYFLQQPSAHLNGQGCPRCVTTVGYSKKQFLEYCAAYSKNTPILYIIRCFNDSEEFIKIGITAKNTSLRFAYPIQLPYSHEIIKEIKGSPDFVWDKEKELHEACKKFTYSPSILFGGHTECFTLECKQILKKILSPF
jgi:hypothetical protein